MTDRVKYYSVLAKRRWQCGEQTLGLLFLLSLSVVVSSSTVFGGAPSPIRQPALSQRDASHGVGDERYLRRIEPGRPIRRELAGGQQHTYQIRLNAGQFLKVVVEQDGIDVMVVVTGPDGRQDSQGRQDWKFDSESMPRGQEVVSHVAEMDGDYQLIVRPRQRSAPEGCYDIRIEELRAATEDDRALQEARRLCGECLKTQAMGPPPEAYPSVERALEIRERLLGPDHRDVAVALNGLGRLYRSRGDYAKAESMFQRSLAILEKSFGPEHPAVIAPLNNLGHLYRSQADYARAEALFQRARAIVEKALGPEHPDFAFALHNLGLLYWTRGNYAKAEPLFLQALAIWKRALNPEHPDLALANSGLGNFYHYRGDNARAETFYRSAISIWQKALGPEHPDVARALNSLSIAYREQGNYEKAEPLARRALAIQERVLGPEHPDVARTLNNLALLHHSRGNDSRAEPLARRALASMEKALGEKVPGPEQSDLAYSLNALALIYHGRGDYAKAEQMFRRSLAVLERALGPKHPYVADVLDHGAVIHAAMGDIARAVAFQSRANTIGEQNLALNLAIGSERQKLAYLETLSKQADRTISLHLRYAPNDSAARDLSAAITLQRKGRALDATSQSFGALRSRSDPQDQALLDKLRDTRSQIASLILGEPQRITAEQYHERIGRLEEQAEELEIDISRRSSEFRAQSLPVTLEAVRAAVPPDSALIEFASYRPFDAKATRGGEAYGQPRYVAYVLRRDGEVQWRELGEVKAIDREIALLREALRDHRRGDVKSLARAVDAKVFQPVRLLLGDLTRLLISPDGSLNLIPFAALVDEQGRYLVERYSISYLASGRDLLRLQVARENKSGPLVIAAPDFGRKGARPPEQNEGAPEQEPGEQFKRELTVSAFSKFYFPPLPYAEREGEALRGLLPEAILLTHRDASKAALSEVRSPSVLHIATHGFFLEDLRVASTGARSRRSPLNDRSRRLRQLERDRAILESPLLRSGLALAGANEQKKEDNGILTALEVTGLNLWGTKLVVLSACDTGVGEVKTGDGVHGLRRALVLAGAESQMMSLWPVSDRGTRELMVAYYRLLKQEEERGEALRQVQLQLLGNVRRQHPYYWASFILSGGWTGLDEGQEKITDNKK